MERDLRARNFSKVSLEDVVKRGISRIPPANGAGGELRDVTHWLMILVHPQHSKRETAFISGEEHDPLDGLLTFITKRDVAISGFWKVIAGPLDPSKDHWAGPGGMGPPGGTGDWRAVVHDYNFLTNDIQISSYLNPRLSPATSKALIQSNWELMKTGGFQGAKEKMAFGIINAFPWYADSWE